MVVGKFCFIDTTAQEKYKGLLREIMFSELMVTQDVVEKSGLSLGTIHRMLRNQDTTWSRTTIQKIRAFLKQYGKDV